MGVVGRFQSTFNHALMGFAQAVTALQDTGYAAVRHRAGIDEIGSQSGGRVSGILNFLSSLL